MDAIAWLSAVWVALYIGVIHDDIKREPTTTMEVRQQEAQTK
jgi:hypothetical protein